MNDNDDFIVDYKADLDEISRRVWSDDYWQVVAANYLSDVVVKCMTNMVIGNSMFSSTVADGYCEHINLS